MPTSVLWQPQCFRRPDYEISKFYDFGTTSGKATTYNMMPGKSMLGICPCSTRFTRPNPETATSSQTIVRNIWQNEKSCFVNESAHMWLEPRWVHSAHRVVPVAREPSAGLAAEGLFRHQSGSRWKNRQQNNSASDRRPAHSTSSRHQSGL